MKRFLMALAVLTVTVAFGTGCSTSSQGKAQTSTSAPPIALAPQPQSTPPPQAPSVYTPPVAVTPSAPASTDGENRIVKFNIKAPDASKVFLAGEFNSWSETDMPMTKQENGDWTASLALQPGHYQYKFIVDDKWTPDPENSEKTDDGYGGFNSVITVPETPH